MHTLDEKMKHILIILNVIAALGLFFFSPYIPKAADTMRHQQVLELCSAGVINTNVLHRHFEDASFPEGRLSLSLSHSDGYFRFIVWPASALALLNATVIAAFWKTKSKQQESFNQKPAATR